MKINGENIQFYGEFVRIGTKRLMDLEQFIEYLKFNGIVKE